MALPQAGVELIAKGLGSFTSDMAKSNQAVSGFGQASTKAAASVDTFVDTMKRAAKTQALTNTLHEQQAALKILEQELAATAQKYGQGSIQAQKKELAIRKLTNAIGETEGKLRIETEAMQREAAATAAAATAATQAKPPVEKLGKATKDAGDDADKSGKSFHAFGEIAIGALRQVGALAVDALGKAAQATGAFLKDSIGLAGDFQAGMLEFQSVAGRDVDTAGLEKFHDLFLQLGKELPVSTSDVEQAAIEMVKGGIDPAIVAAGGLRQNIQFAAAAMKGDLAGAAETSAKILGGWAEAGSTAAEQAAFLTHATDQLTKAANASSVDVHELSLGIFNAQGIAKAAGVSFDDLTTTLAELSPRFASSSEAGTSLKNMIARLQPQTKRQTAAMAALGLYTSETGSAFYDAQGNFVGFQKASELLRNATKDLTNEQRSQMLQTIFGNDAMGAASALAELGATGYQDMADKLAKANGVQAAAALTQQGYNTALENAKGSVEALQITIGEKLLPVLTTFLNDTVAPGINYVTGLAESFFKVYDATGSLVTAIDSIVPGFQSFYDTALPIGTWIGDNLTPILFGVGTAITVAVLPPLIAATTAFLTAAAPIVALVAVGALLYKAWESDFGGIRTAITQWWDETLQPAFAQAQAWLGKYLPVAIEAAKMFFTTVLIPALSAVWSFLTVTVFPAFTTAYNWLAMTIPAATQTTANFWNNTLLPAFTAVSNFLTTYIFPFFQALAAVHLAIVDKAATATAGIWQKVLLPALTAVWGFVDKSIIPIFTWLVDKNMEAVDQKLDEMRYLWQNWLLPALKLVAGYIGGPLDQVFNNFQGFLGDVSGAINSLGSTVRSLIGWLGDLASKIASISLPDWMTPGSPTPWEIGLKGVADTLKTEVNPQIKALFNTLTVAPPASAGQIMGMGAGGSTTNNYTRNLNMPIQTNMTTAAIGQSLAIANAVLP